MIYVHIPYCHSKCAYCDFFSTPGRSGEFADYVEALIKELKLRRGELHFPIKTLYIGGGTPSILPIGLLRRLVEGIVGETGCMPLDEFTIEVNPEDLTLQLIEEYKVLGINRISMGVQTFDDEMLSAIGRRHSADCARRAIEMLKHSGINFSLDLIYGLPDQSLSQWLDSLRELLSYRPPHFSAYLLSYEPGTRLYAKLIAGKVTEASEELASAMYSALCQEARNTGYHHYEISNFALPGKESIHNSAYWTNTPYLGLGVSAHSFDGLKRRFNLSNITNYISAINGGETYYETDEETPLNKINDRIITALRTDRGLDMAQLRRDFGQQLAGEVEADASGLIDNGLLIRRGDIYSIPEEHWLTADTIFRELIRVE